MEEDIQKYLPTVCLGIFFNNHNLSLSIFQGILVPKITLGLFLTLSIRDGPNLESYLFQLYIFNATMFQIQDMFKNGKPDIVLKTVKRFI